MMPTKIAFITTTPTDLAYLISVVKSITKMGELIGVSTKKAVAEAIRKQRGE